MSYYLFARKVFIFQYHSGILFEVSDTLNISFKSFPVPENRNEKNFGLGKIIEYRHMFKVGQLISNPNLLHAFEDIKYSRLSLSRLRLSRITAYLEWKI